MASLNLKNIYKVYPNGTKAVNDFTMNIDDKEFIVFVGPSGCGKSTVLRMIAGLEEISAGELKIDGEVVNDIDCKARDTAMVFQNYALYPHMTVAENMAFPLKMTKLTKAEKRELREETDRRYPPVVTAGQCRALEKKKYLAEIAAENGGKLPKKFRLSDGDKAEVARRAEERFAAERPSKERLAELKREERASRPPKYVFTAQDKAALKERMKAAYPRSLGNLLLYPFHKLAQKRAYAEEKRGNYEIKRAPSRWNNLLRAYHASLVRRESMLAKVEETAKILGLEEYLGKRPGAMSGGQRQRVALGRAMVRHPKVFLLDEPLSNLDAKLRTAMRSEITKLHNRLQTTFIYVTHDQTEAMTMGDRIVVMKAGRIQQIDTPLNLYSYPENLFVAGFIGTPAMNFFDAVVEGRGEGAEITFANGKRLACPAEYLYKLERGYYGKPLTLGVRPEDFFLSEEGVECKVVNSEMLGSETLLYCDFDVSNDTNYENSPYNFIVKVDGICTHCGGDVVRVAVDFSKAHYFDKESGESVMKRFVRYNDVDAAVRDGALVLGGGRSVLPPAIALADGTYRVRFPSDGVTEDGDYAAEVRSCERLKEGWLARLDLGGLCFYALFGREVRGRISVGLQWHRVSFVRENELVQSALDTRNTFRVTLVKRRLNAAAQAALPANEARKFDVDVVCGKRALPCPYPVLKRLMGASDRKLFGVEMQLQFDENAVVRGGSFVAEVKEIYDYGDGRYALCHCLDADLVLPCDGRTEKTISFDIDLLSAALYDGRDGIKIT